jgi:hypothetical protein
VCSRFSSPSTRFSRASSTSVLGPRFFGTASAAERQLMVAGAWWRSTVEHTIDTRAVEHLTCLAGRACAIAFDLETPR